MWDGWFDFNSGDEIVSTSSDGESFRLRTRSVELYCESSNVYGTHNIYCFFCCIVSMYIHTLYILSFVNFIVIKQRCLVTVSYVVNELRYDLKAFIEAFFCLLVIIDRFHKIDELKLSVCILG